MIKEEETGQQQHEKSKEEVSKESAESSQVKEPIPVKAYVTPISFPQRRLGLGKVKATSVSLQLADRSIKYPRGVVEDVFIKVDKFFFPVDFIVLDIEEDRNMPVILGRPFLTTSRTLIDVEKCELSLRVQDEQAVFSMYTIPEQPIDLEECFRVDEGVKIGQENCKPATGGLVAPIKDYKGSIQNMESKGKKRAKRVIASNAGFPKTNSSRHN
ncbi:Uncharacterized protein Adt_44584 [Abeliophyllum distichum]|uniref:Uncharacterized protein n=1 Tax=Abeliophyllum distichum TaxID=126358 RepID=A0ABD1PB92_9LAMI